MKALLPLKALLFFTLLILILPNPVYAQIPDSIKIINLKQEVNKVKQDTARIRIWNEIASLYRKLNTDSMEMYARKAMHLGLEKNNMEGLGYSCKHLAKSYYDRYLYDSTLYYYFKSLHYFYLADNKNMQSKLLNDIGIYYGVKSEYDSALTYFKKSIELAKQTNNKERLSEAIHNIGIVYKHLGNWSKALKYFEESKKLCKELYGKEELIPYYHEISIIHQLRGDYLHALENYHKAMEIAEEFDLKEEIAYLHNDIGVIYLSLKNYSDALIHFQKALDYYFITKNKHDISLQYNNIGTLYERMNSYDSALFYHYKALEIKKEINEPRGIALSYYYLGTIFNTTKEYDKALNYLKQAAILQKNLNLKKELAETYIELSHLYSHKKQSDLAFQYANMAHTIGNEIGSLPIIKISSGILSEHYAKKEAFEKAYRHHIQFKKMSDSLMNESRIKEITELEMQYQFDQEKKQTQFEREQEKILYKSRLKQQKWVRNSFIAGFIILLILGMIIYRSYKNKKKANAEKEALLKEIHHRVKNNLQMISSLLNLQTSFQKDSKIKEAVKESQSRVKSMALIHQLLYQERSLSKINISEYLGQLLRFLIDTFTIPDKNIIVEQNIENIELDIETSVPLGLIITELVSNAYKYAFEKTNEGTITVSLRKQKDDQLTLNIKDNGKGMPKDFTIEQSESLGLKLVHILSEQLDGKLQFISDKGLSITLQFKEELRA